MLQLCQVVKFNNLMKKTGALSRSRSAFAVSKKHYAGLFAGLYGLLVPDGGLDLAYMRLAEHEHRHA